MCELRETKGFKDCVRCNHFRPYDDEGAPEIGECVKGVADVVGMGETCDWWERKPGLLWQRLKWIGLLSLITYTLCKG